MNQEKITGLLEKYSTARHSLGFYNNVAVTAQYSKFSFNGPISALISQALAALITQHPILSAIPTDEDKPDTSFVRLPHIDLRRTVNLVSRKHTSQYDSDGVDRELDEIIEEQHNTNFKEHYGELPFWRVVVLQDADTTSNFMVSFVFHHALCDGVSGLAFHRAFLSALNAATELHTASGGTGADTADPTVYPPKTPILPSLEELHPLPLSLFFFVKKLWNAFFGRSPQNVWTASPITDSTAMRQTRFQSFSLSSGLTQALLAASRAHSTTLTAAIETVFAEALFKHLTPERYSVLIAQGAISLRRALPSDVIDDDAMGTYVSTYVFAHERLGNDPSQSHLTTGKSFWDEARGVKVAIDTEVAKQGKDSVIGLLRYAGNLLNFLNKKVGKAREQSFEMSNIGVFRPASNSQLDNPWRVGRMVFSQSSNVAGPGLGLSVVTGGDGYLTLGISWLKGVLEDDWIGLVTKDMKSRIEELIR